MTEGRPSLEGRRFTAVDNASGEVDAETVFTYHEDPGDGSVWAEYAGGAVVRGRLVGSRTTSGADALDFRYVQLKTDGTTSSGRCTSEVEVRPDGRLRLHETWSWESRQGSGTSTLEELPRHPVPLFVIKHSRRQERRCQECLITKGIRPSGRRGPAR